jgi:energy-converting hydrogenase Eha subunit F
MQYFTTYSVFLKTKIAPMHKTLHKKLTEKSFYHHLQPLSPNDRGGVLLEDSNLLREIAKDLLQPRPQAIANLLKMAKQI